MSRIRHRITACILSAALTCLNVPFNAELANSLTAFAAEEEVISESLTLKADKTVNGDLRLKGGTLDLNGYTLTVKGSVWVDDGVVNIGKGTMRVAGDFELRPNMDSWSDGELCMDNGNGVLDVDGSVELASKRESASRQYAGRIRVGKDFRVWNYYGSKSYCPWSDHITEFKGSGTHEINFDSADVNNLNQVEVTGGGSLYLTGKTSGFKLLSDARFADGSTISGDRNLDLNGNTVTAEGDFRQAGSLTVDLSKSQMTVDGTYWQDDGVLNIGSGTLHVKGDYELRPNTDSWSDGELCMDNGNGVLDVDGSVELASKRESASRQYAGRICVGKDLRVWNYYGSKSYCPWSSHITKFKGAGTHEVNFDSADINNLNQVEVTDGGSLYLTGKTSGFKLLSDARFADGSTISGDRNLDLNGNTVTAEGDFRQAGTLTVDLAGSKMYVAGTYWQDDGVLNIGSGTLNIAKDYELRPNMDSWSSGELCMVNGNGALITGGSVELASTRESASSQYAGTISIGENLKVWNYYGSKSFCPWGSLVTEFRGGKTHEVYFDAAGANHLHIVKLGVGDTISFTQQFGEIGANSGSSITVAPEGLASISELSVTGKSAGEGKMKLITGEESAVKTLIVGASDAEAAYDGGTVVSEKGKLSVSIGGSSVYCIDTEADIPVTIKGEIPDDAWITFVPSDVPHTEKDGDDHNGDWVYLKDIKGGVAHFSTPGTPGTYDIRVFDGDDADTAKEVAYKTVKVVYSDLKATVRVDSKIIKPGEKVKVYLTLSGHVRDDAWVAFIPSDIAHNEKDSDDHNGDYARLKDLSGGYVTITAPDTEGNWDIRVFDGENGDYAREVDYITVVVSKSADVTEPTDPPKPTDPKTTEPADDPTEQANAKLLPGDVNLDGEVSIMDVIAINRYLLGVSKLGSKAKQNANVDGNESIDAADSLLILKYALEIIDTLGGTKAEEIDFSAVKITKYQKNVPANADAHGEMNLSGKTDLSGSSAWMGVVPAGTDDAEAKADQAAVCRCFLRDAYYKEDDHISVGMFVPKGTKPGKYELRAYENDNGGRLISRAEISIVEENTVTLLPEEMKWHLDKDDPSIPVLSVSFTYTGTIDTASLVRILFVPAGTPHDWDSVKEYGGVWAATMKSAGGEHTGVRLPDKVKGKWEVRVYTDTYKDARELDCVEMPPCDLDLN